MQPGTLGASAGYDHQITSASLYARLQLLIIDNFPKYQILYEVRLPEVDDLTKRRSIVPDITVFNKETHSALFGFEVQKSAGKKYLDARQLKLNKSEMKNLYIVVPNKNPDKTSTIMLSNKSTTVVKNPRIRELQGVEFGKLVKAGNVDFEYAILARTNANIASLAKSTDARLTSLEEKMTILLSHFNLSQEPKKRKKK